MSDNFSVYLKRRILEHIFKNVAFTPPTIYVGLAFSILEVLMEQGSTGGYTRVATNAATWTVAVNGEIHNQSAINFPEATMDWIVDPTHFVLWDSATRGTGNKLAFGSLGGRITVPKGTSLRFPTDALSITLEGGVYGFFLGEVDSQQKDCGRGVLSNYTENEMMDHIFGYGNRNWASPAKLYVGLLLKYPGDTATNSNCDEVLASNPSYTRVEISPSDWSFPTAEGATDIFNVQSITFPEALEPWGEVVALGLFDVNSPAVEGNLLVYSPLAPPEDITIGSIPRFPPCDRAEWLGMDFFFDTVQPPE